MGERIFTKVKDLGKRAAAAKRSRAGGERDPEDEAKQGAATLRDQARQVYQDGILNAAERVFCQRGFPGTRMADVAKEAGLAIGTLYNYFPNRDDLLVSLIEQRTKDLLRAIQQATAGAQGISARRALEAVVHASLQHFDVHRELFAVFMDPSAATKTTAASGRRCAEVMHDFHSAFQSVLERARQEGVVRSDIPPNLVLGAFMGVLHGVMRVEMRDGKEPLTSNVPLVLDLFLHGVGSAQGDKQ